MLLVYDLSGLARREIVHSVFSFTLLATTVLGIYRFSSSQAKSSPQSTL